VGIAGLAADFTGVVVMVASQLGNGGSAGHVAIGMGLCLVAGAGFSVGTLIVKHAATRDPGLDIVGFTAVQYIVGSVALVPIAALLGHVGRTDWGSGALLGSIAWVALGSSALASLCFYLALRRVSATRAGSWQFLAPVVAGSRPVRTPPASSR